MPKPKKLPRPTQEYVLDRLAELDKEYERDLEILERIRGLRELSWEVNVPTRLEDVSGATGLEYKDATIASELLELPRLYLDKPPQLQLSTGKLRKENLGLSTRLENFITAALFEDCGARGVGPGTLHRMVDATFEGGGWTKLVKADDVWDDYKAAHEDDYEDGKPGVDDNDGLTKYQRYDRATEEMKKKAGVPVEWVHVDAANARPIFSGHRLSGFIEKQRRSLSTCARDYGFGLDQDGKIVPARTAVKGWEKNVQPAADTAVAECELIMYRDCEWMMYLVRYSGGYRGAPSGYTGSVYEIPGYTRRHKYDLGHPGYYCSLGWTKNYEYGRVCTWSAAEPKRYLVQYLSWLRSIYAYIAVVHAIPPLSVETPPDATGVLDADTGQPKAPSTYEAGMQYHNVPGARMVPLQFPSDVQALQAEIVQTQADINRHAPARKSGELGDLGGEGFALSTVYEKDRARYGAFEDSITQHLAQVAQDFCKLVAQVDETVYVFRSAKKDGGFVAVNPKDFETAFRPTWTLHVDSTAANIIKQRYAEAMEKAGYFSREMAVEFMGQNFDEVMEGLAEDRVRATPQYMQGEEAEVWASMGRGSWAKKQEQAQQMAVLAAQGGGLVPPGTQGATLPGGAGNVPNTGNLTMSPNGAGAAPGQEFRPGGMPSSPSVPQQGATAQVSGGQIG